MDCGKHKLVADVSILAHNQVLLVRYVDVSAYDGQRGWFLPDDHLQYQEHPDAAAARIAEEQAGVDARPTLQGMESFGDGAWHLIFHYVVRLDEAPTVRSGSNVAEVRWFSLDALPPRDEVAHDGWALDVLETIVGGKRLEMEPDAPGSG